ncbi:unnamed protein product [Sphenostylis stenocarpa]|uniref:Secreted protein n=1 Tax=Sphenostylis stenocarpa TaxID=92480 RepID=A0AA86S9C7_9FABA|nr:unnamed protein product [Sphenostylis stenocarpa]
MDRAMVMIYIAYIMVVARYADGDDHDGDTIVVVTLLLWRYHSGRGNMMVVPLRRDGGGDDHGPNIIVVIKSGEVLAIEWK